MKSLIVYSSKSGNTKKLAQAIQALLPGENFLKPMEDNPDPNGFDIICVGFWFQAGKADTRTTDFLQSIDDTPPLFLFATHGAAAGSDHARNGMKLAKELVPSNMVIGTFSCQGEVNSEFLLKAKTMKPLPPWINDAPNAIGHPNNTDIRQLEEKLKEVIGRI